MSSSSGYSVECRPQAIVFLYTDQILGNFWPLMSNYMAVYGQRKMQFVNVRTNLGHQAKNDPNGCLAELLFSSGFWDMSLKI